MAIKVVSQQWTILTSHTSRVQKYGDESGQQWTMLTSRARSAHQLPVHVQYVHYTVQYTCIVVDLVYCIDIMTPKSGLYGIILSI